MIQDSYPGEGTGGTLVTRGVRNPLVRDGGRRHPVFRRPRLTAGGAALDLGSVLSLKYQRPNGGT